MWRFRVIATLWAIAAIGLVTTALVGVDTEHPAVAIPLVAIVGIVFLLLETE